MGDLQDTVAAPFWQKLPFCHRKIGNYGGKTVDIFVDIKQRMLQKNVFLKKNISSQETRFNLSKLHITWKKIQPLQNSSATVPPIPTLSAFLPS